MSSMSLNLRGGSSAATVCHTLLTAKPLAATVRHTLDRKAPAICRVVAKNADAEDAPPFVLGRWWAS